MVDHTVFAVGHTFFYRMIHQVAWQLAGRTTTLDKSPFDLVVFTLVI